MAIKSLLVIGMVLLMESISIAGQNVPTFEYQSQFNPKNSTRIMQLDDGCEVDMTRPYAQEDRVEMNCHDGHNVSFGVANGLYPYRYNHGRGTVSPVRIQLFSW